MSKGASVDIYVRFKVAHRGGELCPICGTIERTVVQNRGSYFCSRCQSLHRAP